MKRLIMIAALAATGIAGVAGVAAAQTPAPAATVKRGPGAADTNGDGVVTRAEAIAAGDALFARLDRNNDGKISADERPGRRGANKTDMTREQFRESALKRFERADANKDGQIDRAERQALRSKRRGHRGGHGSGLGMMMRADANRDGTLTKAEATAAASAMFDRFDTNRDGRIDPTEQDAARDQMKMRRDARKVAPAGGVR
ncbi:EF-hand domain-containing protein [Sphingomonas jeddahensis]|uniref:Transaldolase/EF-hand domain-containing protein n=1 Tax=Sphingomonas jeddahensis TaxID=1915074 RepID=A0A1V2EZA5_9SPHN|nr:EF-hand domain-containing protein [Sphingomonas jeddahensis]ONF97618.1 transaldolase/EF-hand domain-containing protein [Sphingomonas jeddahensis]